MALRAPKHFVPICTGGGIRHIFYSGRRFIQRQVVREPATRMAGAIPIILGSPFGATRRMRMSMSADCCHVEPAGQDPSDDHQESPSPPAGFALHSAEKLRSFCKNVFISCGVPVGSPASLTRVFRFLQVPRFLLLSFKKFNLSNSSWSSPLFQLRPSRQSPPHHRCLRLGG